MYKVYLITKEDNNAIRVNNKTVTRNPFEAKESFMKLVRDQNLAGKPCAAILSLDNRELIRHRFDSRPGHSDYVGAGEEIEIFHTP